MLTDAHTHLDHCEAPEGELVRRALEAGVDLIVQSGTDARSSEQAVRMAETHDAVWATIGTHPHDADDAHEPDLEAIAALASHPKVVAVGETGLDFYRNYASRDGQHSVFCSQIHMARTAGLPLVVHSRAADEESLGILEREAADLEVVLHCFSMPERLDEVVERGYYVSLAGNVTFGNARDLRNAAARVPDERMLVETDAPYLTAVPKRGRPNEPALVRHTYEFLAELRGVGVEVLARQVRANALRVFPRLAGPHWSQGNRRA